MTSTCGCRCREAIAELTAVVRGLQLELAHQRPAREQEDARLVAAMWRAFGFETRTFTTRELHEHARLDTPAALDLRAEISRRSSLSPRRIGKMLASIEGRIHDGLVLEAIGKENGSLVYQLHEFGQSGCAARKPVPQPDTPFLRDRQPATVDA